MKRVKYIGEFVQGATLRLRIRLMQTATQPVDLTGAGATAQLRQSYSDPTAIPFEVAFDPDRTSGLLTLLLTDEATAPLTPGKYVGDLALTFPNGDTINPIALELTCKARVTR